jgi:hypothetical protein
MKYTISDLRTEDFQSLDISEFFPSATEPVIIKIKRLTEKKRSDVVALMMHGQSIKSKGEIEIMDTGWYQKAREIQLLNGVVLDDSFPFEKWDMAFVDALDERNPSLVAKIQEAIRKFGRPLAEESDESLET